MFRLSAGCTDVYALKAFFDLANNLIGHQMDSSQDQEHIRRRFAVISLLLYVSNSPFCALCERNCLLERHLYGQ
jgi:hypothetical protein